MLPLSLYLLSHLCAFAVANVEKAIFVAPSALTVPTIDPALDDLGLERLSPSNSFLRTKVNVSFPTDESPGTESWFFLENLNPGQRYEVRICWLATQPTAFDLRTYSLPDILEDQSLLSALSLYSSARLSTPQPPFNQHVSPSVGPAPSSDSVLFLRILAAADYFSLNQRLMDNPPAVTADVILDPFLGNVFPKSLVLTACWVSVVACLAIVVARWTVREVGRAAETISTSYKRKDQ